MSYFSHIVVLCSIYVILASSLDLVSGHMGNLSLAHAAFYGIGAYTSAILSVETGTPFLVSTISGAICACFISLTISLPSFRLHDDYFAIATFGLQVIIHDIFNNWSSITSGPLGITAIPDPTLFGVSVTSTSGYAGLALIFAGVTYAVVWRLAWSPFGRVLRAIREDEVFAQALGKKVARFKMVTFAVSAALAGVAGSLYAHYVTFIDPSSFTVMESILVISMVIIGGAGSRWGPLVGAILLVLLPELLRFAGLPNAIAANIRMILYGAGLVAVALFRPQGLVGSYKIGE